MAVFGSAPDLVDTSVGSVCSALHIPYLTTGSVQVKDEFTYVDPQDYFSIHLGPTQRDLVRAVTDFVREIDWKTVALISHRPSGTST